MRLRPTLLVVLALGLVAARKRQPTEPAPRWISEGESAQFALLELLIDQGDIERSMALIQVMRDQGRNDDELDLQQGIVARDAGLIDEAHEMLDRAFEAKPRDPRVHEARCVLYANEQRVDEAVTACERAVELDADRASAWNNLGYLNLTAGRADASLEALQTAVRLEPTVARFRNNLGMAQIAVGNEGAGFRSFRASGSTADAHYNVGVAHNLLGHGDLAQAAWRRALDANPRHVAALDALNHPDASENP